MAVAPFGDSLAGILPQDARCQFANPDLVFGTNVGEFNGNPSKPAVAPLRGINQIAFYPSGEYWPEAGPPVSRTVRIGQIVCLSLAGHISPAFPSITSDTASLPLAMIIWLRSIAPKLAAGQPALPARWSDFRRFERQRQTAYRTNGARYRPNLWTRDWRPGRRDAPGDADT